MHLSRLAEEIVIWMSAPFGFVTLSDAYSTGSSMLPQKRNPDAAELVRAKTGRVAGAFMSLLTVMKGLPLAYAKDTQEDKEPVFDAADTLALCVPAMTGMIGDLAVNADNMAAAAAGGYPDAVDLADWLVRTLGMPFREAHHVAGRADKLAEDKGVALAELPIEDLQSLDAGIDDSIYDVLGVARSVESRTSFGGTAPANVAAACAEARRRYLGGGG
jgi:argininosuccinate lyase